MNIAVIVGTTRKERVTPRLAKWVQRTISEVYPEAQVRLLDLAEYDIPLLEEAPWLPDRVLNGDSKRWLADLAWADGYVVATAEYNHGMPAVLKNALDYTNGQMKRKPALIVSQGVVGGARATEHLRLVLNSTIGVVPVPDSVAFIGHVSEGINEDGVLQESAAINQKKLLVLLDELLWYTNAFISAR